MNMKRLLLAVLVLATVGATAQKKSDKAAAPQGIITNGNFDDFEAKEL